jgi:hypothetical protein
VPQLGLFSSALHSGSIAQFREDFFPRNKAHAGTRKGLCPQITGQMHADGERKNSPSFICVHLRHLRANSGFGCGWPRYALRDSAQAIKPDES